MNDNQEVALLLRVKSVASGGNQQSSLCRDLWHEAVSNLQPGNSETGGRCV